MGCPFTYTPADQVIVPFDADRVEVRIEHATAAPFTVGLAYHGAATREWSFPEAVGTDAQRIYTIPVGADGDGPYARQSQWEFIPYIDGPIEHGAIVQEYRITATVYRNG